MAAGMGSRYGGEKQTDGIGPHGEAIMEYSVYDAVRAGFHKIVFIIKPGMEPTIRALCGDRIETMHTPQGEPVEVAICGAGLLQHSGLLYHSPGAEEALRHGPRGPCAPGMWCGSPLLLSTPTTTTASRPMRPFCKKLLTLKPTGEGAMVGYRLKTPSATTGRSPGGLPAGQRQPAKGEGDPEN